MKIEMAGATCLLAAETVDGASNGVAAGGSGREHLGQRQMVGRIAAARARFRANGPT